MKLFSKILIANRGEIAARIIRSLKGMGIRTVAVFSENDRDALFVRMADESYFLSGDTLSSTYLDHDKIVKIAQIAGAEAVHPGYGFLSENALFAERLAAAGINFIGPSPQVIRLMGDKKQARQTARDLHIPLIEGMEGKAEEILARKEDFQYPILLKAAAGGGGKAMRIVYEQEQLAEALETTSREAVNYFGSGELYAEKFFGHARHIEIQVIADHYGNIVIAGERECSVQRRYQKVIEETPSLFLSDETRISMFAASQKIVESTGYTNAGTIEYLVDEKNSYYFLEMNTRIQVEHAITEMVNGIDIVAEQVLIAAGNPLRITQADIIPAGHSIEARLYAEDPSRDFLPAPGRIFAYQEPSFPDLRIDSATDKPFFIDPSYDPMIAKLIVHGHDRDEAIQLLSSALRQMVVLGTSTNRELLLAILKDQEFGKNLIHTNWLEAKSAKLLADLETERNILRDAEVIALWLAYTIFGKTKSGQKNIWENAGNWHSLQMKTFRLREMLFQLIIRENRNGKIRFAIGSDEYRLVLKSIDASQIMIELDGKWLSGHVIAGFQSEDIVLSHGLEFKISPLDFLPEEPYLKRENETKDSGNLSVRSPMHGKLVKLMVSEGSRVKKGEHLFTLDAMKVENKVLSPADACVKSVKASAGEQLKLNQIVIELDECRNQ